MNPYRFNRRAAKAAKSAKPNLDAINEAREKIRALGEIIEYRFKCVIQEIRVFEERRVAAAIIHPESNEQFIKNNERHEFLMSRAKKLNRNPLC